MTASRAKFRSLTQRYMRVRTAVLARALPLLLGRHKGRVSMVRLGSQYGGWWIPSSGIGEGSICYCAGVGEDATFDVELAERLNARVVSLDPTPKAIAHMAMIDVPLQLTFEPIGLAGTTREARFYAPQDPAHASFSLVNIRGTQAFVTAPVRPVSAIMADLGHEKLDLLKLDIEGAEYEVLASLHRDGIYPRVICVEFDQPRPVLRTWRAIRRLRGAGYVTANVERLNVTFIRSEAGQA